LVPAVGPAGRAGAQGPYTAAMADKAGQGLVHMTERIVIVGGGAGGLELACKLGRKLGRDAVTLVEQNLFHVWKPSLHEVAAGTLDIHQEGLSYEMLAHANGFRFVYGPMTGLDT